MDDLGGPPLFLETSITLSFLVITYLVGKKIAVQTFFFQGPGRLSEIKLCLKKDIRVFQLLLLPLSLPGGPQEGTPCEMIEKCIEILVAVAKLVKHVTMLRP